MSERISVIFRNNGRALATGFRLFGVWLFTIPHCGATHGAAPSEARKPANVLLIVVDDLNVDLGCYGNAEVKTPAIDRLAARGVRFERAYSQYPLCNPSRVSFLSGRRPETTGVYVLAASARKALPDAVMLPQFFRERGYFAAGIGKIYHSTGVNDALSWDYYEDGPGRDPQEIAAINARNAAGNGDGRPAWHVLDGDGGETRDGLTTQAILNLMRERRADGAPFFLAAGFRKPHLPWTAPRRFFELYPEGAIAPRDGPPLREVPPIALQTELSGFAQPASPTDAIRGYYACVSFIDHQVGLLMEELDARGLWENTIVVLMSDHGFHLGDHGGLWGKLSAFDTATRVPLIIAGAGVPAGQVSTVPVELLDVYPTLVSLAGFTPGPDLEGVTLLGKNAVQSGPGTARSMVFHYDVASGRDILGRTLITKDWRFTEWSDSASSRELYLRADDSGEYDNRVGDANLAETARGARDTLDRLPHPKPGPSNRPRALVPPGGRIN